MCHTPLIGDYPTASKLTCASKCDIALEWYCILSALDVAFQYKTIQHIPCARSLPQRVACIISQVIASTPCILLDLVPDMYTSAEIIRKYNLDFWIWQFGNHLQNHQNLISHQIAAFTVQ